MGQGRGLSITGRGATKMCRNRSSLALRGGAGCPSSFAFLTRGHCVWMVVCVMLVRTWVLMCMNADVREC